MVEQSNSFENPEEFDWNADDIEVNNLTAGQQGFSGKSKLTFRDLINEMSLALTSRPGRTILTAMGTVLGVAALVATLGLAKTAGSQIVSRFNELEATQVQVEPRQNSGPSDQQRSRIPWDVEDRLERLNGVNAAGSISDVQVQDPVRSVPFIDPTGQSEFLISVKAVSPNLLSATRSRLFTGRTFDQGYEDRIDPVVILGFEAAKKLNISRVDNLPAIFIGDKSFTVIGILSETSREPSLLSSVIVTNAYAREHLGLQAAAKVIIDVEVGAAELIGAQAATALAPDSINELRVSVPPSPNDVRNDVEADVNSLFLVLGGISLLVGAIGIANVTLVSVLERTGEIGLRRALGATRRHIAVQFLSESVALGLFAGILGASFGIITIVTVSSSRGWSPVLEPWLPLAAPIVGAITGLLAGTYPAWKASKLEPIAALRGI